MLPVRAALSKHRTPLMQGAGMKPCASHRVRRTNRPISTLHLAERNGWGDSKVEGIVSLLSGLPYATIYPEFYNLSRDAVNLTALARWDSEKRRISLAFSMPLYGDPRLRLRFYADARNENWNLAQTFRAMGTPLTDLNMRRAAAGVEPHSVVNGRWSWSWSAGVEIANRNFRNLNGHAP